jgi:hypothetical protein
MWFQKSPKSLAKVDVASNIIEKWMESLIEEFSILRSKNELQKTTLDNISKMDNHFVQSSSNQQIRYSEYFVCSDGIPVLIHVYDNSVLIYGTVYYTLIASKKHKSRKLTLHKENFFDYSPKVDEIYAKLNQIRYPLVESKKPHVYKFGQTPNLGHYIWNELTGLAMLFETGLIRNFDWIEVGEYDYFSAQNFLEGQGVQVFKNRQSTDQVLLFKTANIFFSSKTRNWILDEILKLNYPQQYEHKKKIIIQLRTGTRAWKNSPKEIADLINKVGTKYADCKFVLDGHSRIENSEDSDNQAIRKDLDFANAILENISPAIDIESTIGKNFSAKLKELNGAHLVIGPIGSGGLLCNWLLNVEIICFGPEYYYSWTSRDSDLKAWKPRKRIQYYPVDKIVLDRNENYSIDMDQLYDMVIETLFPE